MMYLEQRVEKLERKMKEDEKMNYKEVLENQIIKLLNSQERTSDPEQIRQNSKAIIELMTAIKFIRL